MEVNEIFNKIKSAIKSGSKNGYWTFSTHFNVVEVRINDNIYVTIKSGGLVTKFSARSYHALSMILSAACFPIIPFGVLTYHDEQVRAIDYDLDESDIPAVVETIRYLYDLVEREIINDVCWNFLVRSDAWTTYSYGQASGGIGADVYITKSCFSSRVTIECSVIGFSPISTNDISTACAMIETAIKSILAS